jgi:hypothetical protein
MLIEHEQLLDLSLRMQMTRSMRWQLRKSVGRACPTEHDYNRARDKLCATIPKMSLAAAVEFSGVTSSPHDMLEWMLSLPHIHELLPPPAKRAQMVLVTAITNDGTAQRGNLEHRSLHATLLRVLSIGRRCQARTLSHPLHACVCAPPSPSPRSNPFLPLFFVPGPRLHCPAIAARLQRVSRDV